MGYAGPITNIIVVMLENRSYDNVLGMLYAPGNPAPYDSAPAGQLTLDGLPPDASNVDPVTGLALNAWGGPGDSPTIPETDPGEPFYDMAQQIQGAAFKEDDNPYSSSATAPMGGFVANYRAQFAGGQTASSAGIGNVQNAVRDVMHVYTPWLMPVTAYLARNFMVCDAWFASAPTQTFANRMFAHCATPGGSSTESFLDDSQYLLTWAAGGFGANNVFAQLDAVLGVGAKPNWKVYFHDYSISMGLVKYVNAAATSASNINVASYDQSDYPDTSSLWPVGAWPNTFLADLANGTSPPYSFVEPRYSNSYQDLLDSSKHAVPGLAPNSNHPGLANFTTNALPNNPPISVVNGELFLLGLYSALLASPLWKSSLLVILYDEHGGLYDHVYPPSVAAAASSAIPPASSSYGNFAFNIYGGRVPAIIVSPFVTAGSRLVSSGAPFDHTSIIRTVWDCFNLDQGTHGAASINAWDLNAPSILTKCSTTIVNNPPKPPSL